MSRINSLGTINLPDCFVDPNNLFLENPTYVTTLSFLCKFYFGIVKDDYLWWIKFSFFLQSCTQSTFQTRSQFLTNQFVYLNCSLTSSRLLGV